MIRACAKVRSSVLLLLWNRMTETVFKSTRRESRFS
jgi:hypothetical protein